MGRSAAILVRVAACDYKKAGRGRAGSTKRSKWRAPHGGRVRARKSERHCSGSRDRLKRFGQSKTELPGEGAARHPGPRPSRSSATALTEQAGDGYFPSRVSTRAKCCLAQGNFRAMQMISSRGFRSAC